MRNPNPKQLDNHSVQFWFKCPEQIDISIKSIKETLATLQRKIRHDTEVVFNSRTSLIDVTRRVEIIEQRKEKVEEKKNALAQWIYIKWRYDQTTLEKVVFT